MHNPRILCFLSIFALMASSEVSGKPILLAEGVLAGQNDESKFQETLENGEPADVLGGMDSGLAYAGGDTFLALPDRGPNADEYNKLVSDTTSYICRFHVMTMKLGAPRPGEKLPFSLDLQLTQTIPLFSSTGLVYGDDIDIGTRKNGKPMGAGQPPQNSTTQFYFTGRSDNFDKSKGSGDADEARLDPEAIRLSNDGKSVFVSDEYGPHLYEFDRATGQRTRSLNLPAKLFVATQSAKSKTEENKNSAGRVPNNGMEGLAITPDGKSLVGIIQGPLLQERQQEEKLLRIVKIDIAGAAPPREYAYMLRTGSGVSEILAINNDQFLLLERDGKGFGNRPPAVAKQHFSIDLSQAKDIANLNGSDAVKEAVSKTLFLDIVDVLKRNGRDPEEIPAKIEGMASGADVPHDGKTMHTLYIANDNDFDETKSGKNQVYAFGFEDGDLANFMPQQFAPKPKE